MFSTGLGSYSSTIVSMTPAGNYTGSNAIAISCGYSHTAILLNTGEVMTVGSNYSGELGDGTTDNRNTLVRMTIAGNYTGSNAVAISCGADHTAILLNTGEVMTVGTNSSGKLGRDSDSGVAADWPHSKTIGSMDILRDNPYRGSNVGRLYLDSSTFLNIKGIIKSEELVVVNDLNVNSRFECNSRRGNWNK